MKEKKIRNKVLGIFNACCVEKTIAYTEFSNYCESRLIFTGDVSKDPMTFNDPELFKLYKRYALAKAQYDSLRDVMAIFYSRTEIAAFYDACKANTKETLELESTVKGLKSLCKRLYNSDDKSETTDSDDSDPETTDPADDGLSVYYKKCDDKATLYEKMTKSAIEAVEPTTEDCDSQAKAEAGITDEQMNAIDDAVHKAYEESANN